MAKKKTTKKVDPVVEAPIDLPVTEVPKAPITVPNGEVPRTTLANASTVDLTKKDKKPKTPKVDILRGRMPLVLVYGIKFLETGSTSELAAKYRTTAGKIDDIKKGANFGYITDKFIPTMDMVKAALPRCKELEAGKEIVLMIKEIGIATPDDEVAFAAIKVAMRKKSIPVKTDPKEPEVTTEQAHLAELQEETDETIAKLGKNKEQIDPNELVEELTEDDEDLTSLLDS